MRQPGEQHPGPGRPVSDVYRKWIVGASAGAADNAAVLFANADNPGNPQVQAILRQLGNETLAVHDVSVPDGTRDIGRHEISDCPGTAARGARPDALSERKR